MNLNDLCDSVHEAKEKLADAEDARDRYLAPVLTAAGLDMRRCGVEEVSISSDSVTVTYGWSSRGYSDNDTIQIPLSIFSSTDPVAAASDHARRKKEAKDKAERADKIRQIEQLQKELSK